MKIDMAREAEDLKNRRDYLNREEIQKENKFAIVFSVLLVALLIAGIIIPNI